MDTNVSAPEAIASGTIYSSFLSLFPPIAKPELQSSLFAYISTSAPIASVKRGRYSIGVGP